jgi:hypothetical protein
VPPLRPSRPIRRRVMLGREVRDVPLQIELLKAGEIDFFGQAKVVLRVSSQSFRDERKIVRSYVKMFTRDDS